jgi:hypothetical protein
MWLMTNMLMQKQLQTPKIAQLQTFAAERTYTLMQNKAYR